MRKDSPLIVGQCEDGAIIASDVPALLKYTRTVYYIDNLEIARLTPDSIEFFNIDKEPITRESTTIEWDAEAAEKGGYEHFMMKEINEQPAAVRDTISPRLKDGKIDLSELALDEEAIKNVRRLYIIGCGSAIMWAWQRAMCLKVWPASRSRSMSPASSATVTPCLSRTLLPWSSARAVRPPIRWPPCAV